MDGCISSQVLVRNKKYRCRWVCSLSGMQLLFGGMSAGLLTTCFMPSPLIKALHKALNYRSNVFFGINIG